MEYIYYNAIVNKKTMTLEDVPLRWREKTKKLIEEKQ